jgi:protocatechuate 3,4-dioxygenase beta subunit
MRRRDLLRRLLLSAGGMWAHAQASAAARSARAAIAASERDAIRTATCWVTPQGDEGPYYFDSPARSDIRESKTGVPFALAISVIDSNCQPVEGVLVDVWHCDKDGTYSGVRIGLPPILGQTYLRGTQITDAAGQVAFTSIYPGWYTNRATHVHFKVRSADTTYETAQFCFPEAINDAVYGSPLYATRGPNPKSNSADPEFGSPTPDHLTVALTGDVANGYAGTFTIGLDAATPARRPTWGTLKTRYR